MPPLEHTCRADQPLTIEGDGTHYRDFIHVDDIVRGLVMGYQSTVNGTTVNLGTGSFATVHEVADLVSNKQVRGRLTVLAAGWGRLQLRGGPLLRPSSRPHDAGARGRAPL